LSRLSRAKSRSTAYWEMPFRKSAKFTLTNLADADMTLYYQIDYSLMDVPPTPAPTTRSSAA